MAKLKTMFDSVAYPTNDKDFRGMFLFLCWHMQKQGMSSTCISYMEKLYKAAEKKTDEP